jgi:L-fucose mutarotase
MLKINLLHPDILQALGSNGHGARILIADGNFPITTHTPAFCKKVFLNLAPDLLTVIDVLKVMAEYISVESGIVMRPPDDSTPAIHREFQQILGEEVALRSEKRMDFYHEAKSEDVCLAVATGETRRFANIIIVMGSVKR